MTSTKLHRRVALGFRFARWGFWAAAASIVFLVALSYLRLAVALP